MARPRLLQLSGAVIDLIYRVEALPERGEEARVLGSSLSPGGGYNAMIAAKRAGMAVAYAGSHGAGPFSEVLRRSLQLEGIAPLLPPVLNEDQGLCTVLVDAEGERTFITRDGAERAVTAADLKALETEPEDWWLLSGYGLASAPSREALEDWLRSSSPGLRLVFDPSPLVAEIPSELLGLALSRASWISSNRREAEAVTGGTRPEGVVQALQELSAGGGAVLRCGEEGCWLATAEAAPRHLPAFAVDAIDSNGAGDTHIGSFIAALSAGAAPLEAARFANAAAALSTTREGPANAPEAAETRAFLARVASVLS